MSVFRKAGKALTRAGSAALVAGAVLAGNAAPAAAQWYILTCEPGFRLTRSGWCVGYPPPPRIIVVQPPTSPVVIRPSDPSQTSATAPVTKAPPAPKPAPGKLRVPAAGSSDPAEQIKLIDDGVTQRTIDALAELQRRHDSAQKCVRELIATGTNPLNCVTQSNAAVKEAERLVEDYRIFCETKPATLLGSGDDNNRSILIAGCDKQGKRFGQVVAAMRPAAG